MKKNVIPNSITKMQISSFDFGKADAKQDELLEDTFCLLPGIKEIFIGNKTYVLGVKGSGKTAIFEMLKSGNRSLSYRGMPVGASFYMDDEIQFNVLATKLGQKFLDKNINDEITNFQFLWEIFFIYNVLNQLNKKNLLSDSLHKIYKDWLVAYGAIDKFSLIDVIKSLRATVTFQLNDLNQTILPSFSFEQSSELKAISLENKQNNIVFNLNQIKNEISNSLKQTGQFFCIAIDRLDDYVSGYDYKIQCEMLTALAKVERNYSQFSSFHFLIFMRPDLFYKIDWTTIGQDKISDETMELTWNDETIKELIAKRIYYNYKKIFMNRRFSFKEKFLILLKKDIFPQFEDNEEFHNKILLSIFKKEIIHYNSYGVKETINLFDFYKTHFSLANEYATPRIIISFLHLLMEKYRDKNNDESTTLELINNSFSVFDDNLLLETYNCFQEQLKMNFLSIDTKQKDLFEKFILKQQTKYKFTYPQIEEMLGKRNNKEIREFLGYLEYIGYLKNKKTSTTPVERREYELPIIFRVVNRKD